VSATPTLAWAPPAGVGANSYRVAIRRVVVGAQGATELPEVLQITTDETALAVPRGLLMPGESYLVMVRATSAPGSAPWTAQLPFSQSRVVSKTFQVQ
jgi:hypothetical protein